MGLVKNLSFALLSAGFAVVATATQAFSLSLKYDSSIGSPGFGPGQLFVPQGVIVDDATGNVLVSNGRGVNPDGSFNANIGNKVEVFSSQGNYLGSIGSGRQGAGEGFDEPGDLKISPVNGNLYVADVFNSEIDVFDPQGNYLKSFGKFGGPVEGRIFFGPGGLSFDKSGNLYVTDFSEDTVKVYTGDGELTKTIGGSGTGLGQFQGPAGISVSPNTGNIYVNDQYNYRVQAFDPQGNALYTFGSRGSELGQLREGIGLEVDEYENLYVADSQNNRVQVFDQNGKFLTAFGEPVANAGPPAPGELPFATDPADLAPGKFNWTAGAHYDDGKLYVGDFFTGRIQVLKVEGQSKKVPEPSTALALGLLGIGAIVVKLKKDKRQRTIISLEKQLQKTTV
jgi:DNA-binding beta-propeller fold protein YncE